MDRRTFLHMLAATAVVACSDRDDAARPAHIVVVGAGIIGASIAWHLAKAGVAVTVIDKEGPATHASLGTFAWINATWAKQPRSYHAFTQAGVSRWHDLQADLKIPVRWGGSLEWLRDAEELNTLAERIDEQQAWGEPARMIKAPEFADLEPGIRFDADLLAAFSPNDGAVDPALATSMMLDAAQSLGAKVLYPCELLSVRLPGQRLTGADTSTGLITADRVVIATGASPAVPRRIAGIDIPQRSTPGIIVITQPLPRLMNRIIAAPGIHMHQRQDGRVVLGEQDGAPATDAHARRLQARPRQFPDAAIAQEHARRMLAVATQFAPALAEADVNAVHIGWRPLPIDGHPVIGPSPSRPDVYLAIMHSGVTLAPLVGELAAGELLSGTRTAMLEDYRPERSFSVTRRY